ncbi:hypothetical protein [Caballeronia sp. LZ016]|uniref:hypothetical protein n=1 Tax=Caballeronia sp. LZ016 TaxID=3038554 RepID=UPI0028552D08|nr:hypothetical protein [Caballeronia sp. LZ016]MDR5740188.1 hypothetical protein [Caballeronia sp. LZ016]
MSLSCSWRTLGAAAAALALGSMAVAQPGFSQSNQTDDAAIGAAVLARVQAQVTSIDTATNSVFLRGPRGNVVEVEVNPEVADVSKLQVGDVINIAYKNAILISADKIDTKGVRERIETSVTQPASDGTVATARRVEVVATVQKIDRRNRQITLRGPRETAVFDVVPDVSLDNLKVGDSVRAVIVVAAAASLARDGSEVN